MTTVVFSVPGPPVGKERPRVARSGTYTPPRTVAYEQQVAWTALPKMRGMTPCAEDGVSVRVDIYPSNRKTPDVDNVLKAVLDALQGVVYQNDRQVTQAAVTRHPVGADARVDVTVTLPVHPKGENAHTRKGARA